MADLNDFQGIIDEFHGYLLAQSQELYPEESDLHRAIKYALQSGGKRVRPLLTILVSKICQGSMSTILPAALAIEMIHTYSLVHDDLPCMDDDDFRRGRPTTHKAFSEATALLVGDALLTDAFSVLCNSSSASSKLPEAVSILARAAGGNGMVLGQSLDLFWTGRSGYSREQLNDIHSRKTAHLIAASCSIGAVLSPSSQHAPAFHRFGEKLGLAFQIVDDLLDDCEGTGKSQGKDQAQGKLTYLSIMSRKEAEDFAAKVTDEAFQALATIPEDTETLNQLARALLRRSY